jgi:predicted lipase
MKFLLGCLAFAATAMADYNDTEARISLQLSQDAYCGRDKYMTHVYEGYAVGFIPKYIIYNFLDDTEGFIGYLPSNNSIYVSFRGSVDIRNWITNLSTDKTKWRSYPECECEVHDGFYSAEQAVFPDVLNVVNMLHELYPTAAIKVTGHSLGAAMAILTGLDLIKYGYNVQMYNFGQPRVGNDKFSNFVKTIWPEHWRVVHHQDMVPHNPPSGILFNFFHTCTERYEDKNHVMHACTNTCEDPTCAE